MRTFISTFQAMTAAAAIVMLAGCSGGSSSSIAPKPASLAGAGPRFVSPHSCPASGPIKYVSDALYSHSVINIYAGKFAGQAPCGQITSGLASPDGLFVQPATHDLYVANAFNNSIQVFHRGQTTPYNTYTNPTNPPATPNDVTVAKDGTVIVTYTWNNKQKSGSYSTWIGGPNGGTFVGNFPMPRNEIGEFVAVQKNGTVYFDTKNNDGPGKLWSVSCPSGACGKQVRVAGVRLVDPEGMAFDAEGDLIVADLGSADTFELPNPEPSTFPLGSQITPMGMDINRLDHHLFVVDYRNNRALEYSYPGGTYIGSVLGNPGGLDVGIAVDP